MFSAACNEAVELSFPGRTTFFFFVSLQARRCFRAARRHRLRRIGTAALVIEPGSRKALPLPLRDEEIDCSSIAFCPCVR